MILKSSNIKQIIDDGDWCLFLDRDGVINRRLPGDYVKKIDEFEFILNAEKSIAFLSKIFKRVFIVTNQQGIGKNLMTEDDLEIVHQHLISKVKTAGGKIDKIYYCPELAKNNPECRKPEIGMAKQAKTDFTEVNFEKSIMIGDSISDMKFAKNTGMISIAVGEDLAKNNDKYIDFKYKNLDSFAKAFNL